MPWTQDVMRLQDVDLALDEHEDRLAHIEAALADTTELQAARKEAVALEQMADTARRAQQELEFQLSQVQLKAERDESSLYSGRITNTRELQGLQEEVRSLKRRIGALEDDLLEAMIAREDAAEAAKTAAAQRDELQRRTAEAKSDLMAERDELRAASKSLQAEQQALRSGIPESVVDSYDYLRTRIGSLPVAQLKGEVCGVCGMVVTPPIRQQVRRGQEAYCNNCRRLLVD